MMTDTSAEFTALKARLQATWMAGDFGQIAKYSEAAAEQFIARRAITPGMRVLDVACGTGNLAIPAAKAGAIVTGADIAPNLLEQARARAQREGVQSSTMKGMRNTCPTPIPHSISSSACVGRCSPHGRRALSPNWCVSAVQ